MRNYCPNCHYPQSTCVCEHVNLIDSPVTLVILQHPKEVGHAKNTVRLLQLCLPSTQVVVGKSADDFYQFQQQISAQQCALIYPSGSSQPMEQAWSSPSITLPSTLIFIDASWRQAYAIWKSNPWLHAIRQYHFEHAPKSQYQIRHTGLAHSLSTLEAVAYGLKVGYAVDTRPLLDLQTAMQNKWLAPKEHARKL